MNLTIDIGNTRAKLVVFEGSEPVEDICTSNETLEGLPQLLSKYPIERGIVASTIPLSTPLQMLMQSLPFPMMMLNSRTRIPIENRYKTPETLGPDRLAAVIGASTLQPSKDLLVIDAGTCITYEFIDHESIYWGGNIAPGLQMRLEAVHEKTARLPLITAEGDNPEWGYDTETAIRSGVLQGMKFEIEGYIRQFREKYPSLLVFLTGGDELNLDTSIKSLIFADKFLVPRGLNRILEYNI